MTDSRPSVVRGLLMFARETNADLAGELLEAMRAELPPGPVMLRVRVDGEHLDLFMGVPR